jgi:hypothetical protein
MQPPLLHSVAMNVLIPSILRSSFVFFLNDVPIRKNDNLCVKLFFVMELVDKVLHAV